MSDADKTPFERQRDILIQEIVVSFDQVLTNLNHLNRSLEGVSAVGREFESVEALWAKFDAVMSKNVPVETREPDGGAEAENGNGKEHGENATNS